MNDFFRKELAKMVMKRFSGRIFQATSNPPKVGKFLEINFSEGVELDEKAPEGVFQTACEGIDAYVNLRFRERKHSVITHSKLEGSKCTITIEEHYPYILEIDTKPLD